MHYIDELYEMYKGHFNGAEEDIIAIVVGTLQEKTIDELFGLIGQMSDEEVFHMIANHYIELLKRKVAMEDERSRNVLH